jgi:hypothetical protein
MIILLNNFDIILLKEFGLIEEFELIDDNIKNFDITILENQSTDMLLNTLTNKNLSL